MLLRELCEYMGARGGGPFDSDIKDGRDNAAASMPPLPYPFLQPMLEIEDKKPVESRLSENTDYIHVSSLLDLCPRQYALARHHKLNIKDKVLSGQRIIWEMGKALEAHAIKNMEQYHGKHLVHRGAIIYNDEYMIQGAPDVIVDIDDTIVVAVEIKSMKAEFFKKLEAARGDHILQAALYRWLLEKSAVEYKVHDNIIILYVSKDAIRGSPYKEFQVSVNDPMVKNGVNIALKLAKELKDSRENKVIPRRFICNRRECARANQCPTADFCWDNPEEEYSITNG